MQEAAAVFVAKANAAALGRLANPNPNLNPNPNPNPNPNRLLEAERRAERVRQLGGDPQHVLRVLADRRLQRRLRGRPLVRPAQSVVRRPRVRSCELALA